MSVVPRLTQTELYHHLRQRGSAWLKRHIVYLDRQIAVLNKPPGLVCQTYDSRYRGEDDLKPLFKDLRDFAPSRWEPHQVHRLDKGTTGCLVIALNGTVASTLSRQLREGLVTKTYLALVRGGEKSFVSSSGRITDPLIYNDGRGIVHPDGKASLTEWKLLASSPRVPLSLIQMNLITGNKHQLRLHLSQCLHTPILGDTLHSRSTLAPAVKSWTTIPEDRIFLHASEVSLFKYLSSGQRYRLSIRAPLPADFQRICRDIGLAIPDALEKEFLSVSETRYPDVAELNELLLWGQYQDTTEQ